MDMIVGQDQPTVKTFAKVLCVDGSANKQSKRPVYRLRQKPSPSINRFRHSDGVLAILDKKLELELLRPLLITVDVPIGLPAAFQEVWKEFGGFLPWLDGRLKADWETVVVDSVEKQTPRSPFVVCRATGSRTPRRPRGSFAGREPRILEPGFRCRLGPFP